jgi:hypothetical protein
MLPGKMILLIQDAVLAQQGILLLALPLPYGAGQQG